MEIYLKLRSISAALALGLLGIPVTVSGAGVQDKQAPTVPTNIGSSAITMTGFTVTWTASTDKVGVTGYEVFLGGVSQGTVATPSKTFTALVPGTVYSVTVRAGDAAANWSAQSTSLGVTTTADTSPPTVPTGLAAGGIGFTGFTVTWTASTDNVAVAAYEVFLDGTTQGTVATPTKAFAGLVPGTTYSVTVRARDSGGNWSSASTALAVTTPPDSSAPSAPTGLSASGVTATAFTASWTASTDNVGVSGYEVFLDGNSQGVQVAANKAFSGLQPSTTYTMSVKARDAAGNWSAPSTALSITTLAGAAPAYSISASEAGVVVAKSDGTVWAWGRIWGDAPVRVGTIATAKSVAASYHTLILQQNGTVLATGGDNYGQLGGGTLTTPISSFSGVADVAAGSTHSLAFKTDGTLYGWGGNQYGQVGNNKTTNVSGPTKLNQISGIIQVAAGRFHSMALKSDGTVLAWGYNGQGQVGNGTSTDKLTPGTVSSLTGIIAIAAGGNHCLALKNDGTVWAWGENTQGQLGDSSLINRLLPVQVAGLTGVTAISAGRQHSLARKGDGSLWGWGANGYRQTGTGTSGNLTTATRITILNTSPKVIAGGDSSYALMPDGTIRSWGSVAAGMLGDGGRGLQLAPIDDVIQMRSEGSDGFGQISLVRRNGTVMAWGQNAEGELGDGTAQPCIDPKRIVGLENIVYVERNIALRSDGTVLAWGRNESGQLGNGTTVDRLTPGVVPGLTGVIQIASGYSHRMALKSNGSVWIWGNNANGELGDGTLQSKSTPIQVPGLANIVWVAAGGQNSFAVGNDGTVWSWGGNWWGTGLANNAITSSPRQALVSNITKVSSAGSLTLFLTGSGQVYICGFQNLGVGPWYGSDVPLLVPNIDSAVEICANYDTVVRASDGRVWKWSAGTGSATPLIALEPGISNPQLVKSATRTGLVYHDGLAVLWTAPDMRPAGFENVASQVADFRLASSASDSDGDGLPDAWEMQVFGSLTHAAAGDDDGDGLTNVQEYLRNTSPTNANMDGDRLSDSADQYAADFYNGAAPTLVIVGGNNQLAEINKFNSNPFDVAVWTADSTRPLVNAPVAFNVMSGGGVLAADTTGSPPGTSSINLLTDVDGTAQAFYKHASTVGVTSTIRVTAGSAQIAFNSTSTAAAADTDGDGLPDPWELQYFGNLSADPNADPDQDGITNFQEYQLGTNPTDFYNGVLPQFTSLVTNNQPGTQGLLSIKVTKASNGAVLANAPVTFSILSGLSKIATSPSGIFNTQIVLRTDAQGIANVYLEGVFLITHEQIVSTATNGTENVILTLSLNPPASVDSDQNGLPDWWEMKHYSQLGVNPNSDTDGDGANALQEYQRGTSPTLADPASSSAAALRIFTPLVR